MESIKGFKQESDLIFFKKKKVHFGSRMEKGWHGIKVGGKKINLEAAAVKSKKLIRTWAEAVRRERRERGKLERC